MNCQEKASSLVWTPIYRRTVDPGYLHECEAIYSHFSSVLRMFFDPFCLLSFFRSSVMMILQKAILLSSERPNPDPRPAPLLIQPSLEAREVAIILLLLYQVGFGEEQAFSRILDLLNMS